MFRRAEDFDWTQARAFLAAAEAGSFSGAARGLGLSQPTLSRQVAALEADLGVTLFERLGHRLQLTETGLELLGHVRAMAEGAERVLLTAGGRSEAVEGRVTITAVDLVAMHVLPPALHRLRRLAPGIEVEILASNALQDLRRREADISVRHVRPTEAELIGRSFGEWEARLYAATRYLDSIGRPATPAELAERGDFIHFGFTGLEEVIGALREHGVPVTRRNFAVGSAAPSVAWEMIRQGLGMGLMMRRVAERTPDVEPALPSLPPTRFPTWLVTHREVRTSRRIRIVYDALAEVLAASEEPQQPLGESLGGAGIGPGGG